MWTLQQVRIFAIAASCGTDSPSAVLSDAKMIGETVKRFSPNTLVSRNPSFTPWTQLTLTVGGLGRRLLCSERGDPYGCMEYRCCSHSQSEGSWRPTWSLHRCSEPEGHCGTCVFSVTLILLLTVSCTGVREAVVTCCWILRQLEEVSYLRRLFTVSPLTTRVPQDGSLSWMRTRLGSPCTSQHPL